MREFKQFLAEQEEKEFDRQIDEQGMAQFVANALGYGTAALITAFGASLLVLGGIKALRGLKNIWKKIFQGAKELVVKPEEMMKDMKSDPQVEKVETDTKRVKRQYEDELKKVYMAISNKDFDQAKEEFEGLEKAITSNPDVQRAVITEITKVMEAPPLYIRSPGNDTYQAIKKVLGIQTARAAARATEMALKKEGKVESD